MKNDGVKVYSIVAVSTLFILVLSLALAYFSGSTQEAYFDLSRNVTDPVFRECISKCDGSGVRLWMDRDRLEIKMVGGSLVCRCL